MKDLGVHHYRFSLAWARLCPTGYCTVHDSIEGSGTNDLGIQHYKDFIAKLKAADIEPFVTLYHWDLPQGLQGQGLRIRSGRKFVRIFLLVLVRKSLIKTSVVVGLILMPTVNLVSILLSEIMLNFVSKVLVIMLNNGLHSMKLKSLLILVMLMVSLLQE